MNGNPIYHLIALGVATVLMVPLPVAMLAGWTPPWLRGQRGGVRLQACGVLAIYAMVLANSLPRIADASFETVMLFTSIGLGFSVVAGVLLLLSALRNARRAGR